LVFSASKSNNDFHIKIKKHTDAYTYRGEVILAKNESIELWIGTNVMTYMNVNGENRYVLDLNKKRMILINAKHKTYVEAALPLKLPSILNDLALLRWETSQQTTGSVSKSDETKMIKEWPCIRFDVKKKGRDKSELTIWTTTKVPFETDVYNKMMGSLETFLNFNYSDKLNTELKKINGFPIFIEEIKNWRGARIRSTFEVVEISKKLLPANIHFVPANYLKKEKISYEALRAASPGPQKKELSKEGEKIVSVLKKLQDGYFLRDTSIVEKWVKDLFTEDVYIIGTNATYPESFEWREGHKAAVEMFSNDWRRWGDLKMYIDEADISVDNKSAWVAMFATVTKKPGHGPSRYRSADTSRRGSLARIREMTESESSSVLALYEIIHDASMVLVQYERSHEFIWPIRMTLGMVKRSGKWLFKQIHWSLPGRGFPVVRLLKNEN
jgi:hypothetical protein